MPVLIAGKVGSLTKSAPREAQLDDFCAANLISFTYDKDGALLSAGDLDIFRGTVGTEATPGSRVQMTVVENIEQDFDDGTTATGYDTLARLVGYTFDFDDALPGTKQLYALTLERDRLGRVTRTDPHPG